MKPTCIIVSLTVALTASGARAVDKPPRPAPRPALEYATDRVVELLGGLLDATDPRTREAAVRDLGETGNTRAVAHVARALDDENVLVRCAAVRAAGGFEPRLAAPLVSRALHSSERRVLLAGLDVARDLSVARTATLVALLDDEHPDVRAATLSALSARREAAPAPKLARMLDDPSPAVRLAAAQNAIALPADGAHAAVLPVLRNLAERARPALRAAALPALCKLGGASDRRRLPSALNDESPWVRRGAVRAMGLAAEAGLLDHADVEARLTRVLTDDDETEMVHLAALRAAGRLPFRTDAGIDAVVRAMLDAPYDDWDARIGRRGPPAGDLHHAARTALLRMAGDAGKVRLLNRAREALRAEMRRLLADDAAQRVVRLSRRNARTCCLLMGAVARNDGPEDPAAYAYDDLLKWLGGDALPIESSVRVELSEALAGIARRTGDRRCVGVLLGELDEYRRRGIQVLRAAAAMRPGPPYLSEAAVAAINALAELRVTEAWQAVARIALVRHGGSKGLRLDAEAGAAARASKALLTPDNRAEVARTLTAILADEAYGARGTRFDAAIAAGELKLDHPPLLDALRQPLKGPQPLAMMPLLQASRWALEQITGEAPDLPEIERIAGYWIIRELSE
ncbi:MAG: HEAT repeat domain-containing protein [Planctomycetota bacterium]